MLKKVLIVTETGDALPSGRIRALIYKKLFAADGINVHYVTRRVPGITKLTEYPSRVINRLLGLGLGRGLTYFDGALARAKDARIIRLAKAGRYEAIYLQKVRSWPLVSGLRSVSSGRLVYDLLDSAWLPWRASFAGGKLRDILQAVDAVTCDNPHGLEFARAYNTHGFIVPDPCQVELFDQHRQQVRRGGSPMVLGWIGSPGTLFNLYSIWEPLEALFSRFDDITLRVIGVGHDRRLLPRFERVRYTALPYYSQLDMVREVLRMDIGLFPLFDVEDSLARGVLKATIYMSGGACVITRPIGQNCELIKDGENGVFARTTDEWLDRLSRLVREPEWRRSIAAAGLQTVRERFSLRHCYKRLLCALQGS